MSRALGLMSGGLDSSLAALVLKRQGVEVTGIAFVTPFFGADRARAAAEKLDFPLIVRDISDIHLEMLKNPRYGYGRNLNPCIDCHALMFRLAGEVMVTEGFDFLFSGEVLGQRPMSQNATALRTVAKHSGVPDRILRPLSAKLLPVTPMEEAGLVDRAQLLDIQGRTRRRQQELAREWGFTGYPASGGGCLLTEASFTGRLRDLLTHNPQATPTDIELLKCGRCFRLSPTALLALGRNQGDNERLKTIARFEDVLLRAENFSGPLGVVSGAADPAALEAASAVVASYGKGKGEARVTVLLQRGEERWTVSIVPATVERCRELAVD